MGPFVTRLVGKCPAALRLFVAPSGQSALKPLGPKQKKGPLGSKSWVDGGQRDLYKHIARAKLFQCFMHGILGLRRRDLQSSTNVCMICGLSFNQRLMPSSPNALVPQVLGSMQGRQQTIFTRRQKKKKASCARTGSWPFAPVSHMP